MVLTLASLFGPMLGCSAYVGVSISAAVRAQAEAQQRLLCITQHKNTAWIRVWQLALHEAVALVFASRPPTSTLASVVSRPRCLEPSLEMASTNGKPRSHLRHLATCEIAHRGPKHASTTGLCNADSPSKTLDASRLTLFHLMLPCHALRKALT